MLLLDSNKRTTSKLQAEDRAHLPQAEQDNAKNPEAKHKNSTETEETKMNSNDSTEESLLKSSKPRGRDSSETN